MYKKKALFFLFIVHIFAATAQPSINIHDPVIIQQDSEYHLFATGKGIVHWSSLDLVHWNKQAPIFDTLPWAVEAVKGFSNHIWAPDIAYYNNLYYLFYSISTFGKNSSCIGVVTNKTLNIKDPNYKWIDVGKLFCSQAGKDSFNAIDPNFIVDENKQAWLVFGSFWSGIQLMPLAPNGWQVQEPIQLINIAKRTKASNGNTALEAPFIFRKKGYYYLFVSADLCCKGAESTYKILVGRSLSIKGPYIDKEGKDMLQGGGSILQQGDGEHWYAVGHNAVAVLNGKDYIVYHGYDATDKGKSKLIMKTLEWTSDGWPTIKE